MAVFDITKYILSEKNGLHGIKSWLEHNVGPYYGRGEDPVVDIGSGWEILIYREHSAEGISIGWQVDITDSEKSVLFALTW